MLLAAGHTVSSGEDGAQPPNVLPANNAFSPLAFPLDQMLERTATRPYVPGELSVAFVFDSIEAKHQVVTDNLWQTELVGLETPTWSIGMDYVRDDGTNPVIVDLKFDPQTDVSTLMKELADAPHVVWSSPTFYFDGSEDPRELIPNDPSYGSQYHHPLMQNNLAWDITTGDASVIVAVTDDGVLRTHNDLAPNIFRNQGEIAGDGIDNDGNGYVDDIEGWDFISADNNPNPNGSDDHGTHVAGIVAARVNNALGVAGTAGSSTIMPIKFYDGVQFNLWTGPRIRESFEYSVDNGAQIVSTSYNINGWVGDANFTAGLQYIHDSGSLHFNSAGNGSELNPARQAFEQTLLVASTQSNDVLSSFSNYGTGVDIAAPGSNILSTVLLNGYGSKSGTSMSTPNAAGAAALIWSANPTWTNYQVAAQLLGSADNIDAANPSRVGLLGGGRVNTFQALTTTLAAPRVVELEGLPANGTVTEDITIDGFTMRFDKLLDPVAANDAANFELVNAGPDGQFDTSDDELVGTSLVKQYMVGSNDIAIDIASTLEIGDYRFRIVAAAVTDPFGTELDGDADGVAGDDFVSFFSVVNPFKAVGPEPSLIARRVDNTASLTASSLQDRVAFYVESGESVTAIAVPTNPSASITIELAGVGGPVTSAMPGEPVVLPLTAISANGDYELVVSADIATNYSLEVFRNVDITGLEDGGSVSLDDSLTQFGMPRYAALATANGSTGSPEFLKYNNASLFVDISSTGTAFGLSDDGEANFTSTIGNELMPAGTLTIGNNGVVAFGGGRQIDYVNESLPTSDFAAALLPFWDDIDSDSGNVYVEQRVVNGIEALIVQWDNRPHFSNVGSATFQLQLFDTGPVAARFAYEDVDFGNPAYNGGASATIGYQSSATVGAQFSYNQNVLANGDVIDIVLTPATVDTDSFTIDLSGSVGNTVDVIVKNANASGSTNFTLELRDPTGSVVATSGGTSSFDAGIFGAPIQIPGTYTVDVSAGFAGSYYLVAADNAAIDDEPNNTISGSTRNLSGMGGAFGVLSASPAQVDVYAIDLIAGQEVDFTTLTPLDDPNNEPGNSLDPFLEVLNGAGSVLASDNNSAGDGKNSALTFSPTIDGTYYLRVGAAAGAGHYVLSISAQTDVACDIDGNGSCDVADLRVLYDDIDAGTAGGPSDLDGSGLVDNADIDVWLADAGASNGQTYLRGDANLDGTVGGDDFTVFASGFGSCGLPGAYWDEGNFDGNASPGSEFCVDGGDFTTLASNFGFASPVLSQTSPSTMIPRAATANARAVGVEAPTQPTEKANAAIPAASKSIESADDRLRPSRVAIIDQVFEKFGSIA